MITGIISTIGKTAENDTPEKRRESYEKQIRQRVEECLKIEQAELHKKAIDLGKSAPTLIDSALSKTRAIVMSYIDSHMDEIISNKQEVLHISELETRSTTREYRNGKIIKDLQRIVIFQRG